MARKTVILTFSALFACTCFAGYYNYVNGSVASRFSVSTIKFDEIGGGTEMYTANNVEDLAEIVYTNALSNAVSTANVRSTNYVANSLESYIPKNYDQWYKDPDWESSPGILTHDRGSFSWEFYGIHEDQVNNPGLDNVLWINHSTNGISMIGMTPHGGKIWNYLSIYDPSSSKTNYLGDALAEASKVQYDQTFSNNVFAVVTNRNPVKFTTPWKLQSVSDSRVGNVYVEWISEESSEYEWYQEVGWMVKGDNLMSMPVIDSSDPLATRIEFYNAIEDPTTEEGMPWIDVTGVFVRDGEGYVLADFVCSTPAFTNSVEGIVNSIASTNVTAAVDAAMKDMLGDNWKTTYGTGLGGLLAAILAAIIWLKNQVGNAADALSRL